MKQIRSNVFETNSSSTHSIAISKKSPVVIGEYISFRIGEFGWENGCADTADYLYTAILERDDRFELLDKLKKILDKNSIEYSFEEPKLCKSTHGEYYWLEDGYIDHAYELADFINAVFSDEDLLMRYLFGDSTVYTGNDNQDCDPEGCDIAEPYYWDWDGNEHLNPYHDPQNYDYFYKGN